MTEPIRDEPAVDSDAFVCPTCQAYATMNWNHLQFETGSHPRFLEEPRPGAHFNSYNKVISWQVARCSRCKMAQIWRDGQMIWPRKSTMPAPHNELDGRARELYDEASAVVDISPRAAAALVRASLEQFLRAHFNEPRGRLQDMISRLKATVSESTWKMLDLIRVLGNASLHDNDDEAEVVQMYMDDTAQTAEWLFTVINMLTEELVAIPRKVDKYHSAIPERQRTKPKSE